MNRFGRDVAGERRGSRKAGRGVRALAAVAALAVVGGAVLAAGPLAARADVVKQGDWPSDDPKVTLTLGKVSRAEALQKLADAAKWSLVMVEQPGANETILIHLVDVPASVVLDAILMGGDWVATRNGSVVRIAPRASLAAPTAPSDLTAPTPPAVPAVPALPAMPGAPPEPPPASIPTRQDKADDARAAARDVSVTGDSVRIEAGQTVRDVTVMGGSAEIDGHVTGDVAVVGGSVVIRRGAHVEGDAQAIGGSITIEEGARVDGETNVVGGVVLGAENARGRGVRVVAGGEPSEEAEQGFFARAGRAISNAVSSAALLFVLGAVLIALAGDRFDQLRGEIAARPMRSIAMGLVGGLGSLLALVVLCVTVVGIPFAAVGLMLFIFAIFAGTASAATTAGAAIAGHRVRSPYGHLAVGCSIYLVAGLLPWIGGWMQLAMILAGYGAIVATRAAGLIKRKGALPPASPYR